MKFLKTFLGLGSLYILLFTGQVNFSSCQKPPIIIRDTITVRDTIHVVDSSTCSCYDLKDGLVAYYNFNGGTLKDSSGNNNHITFSNAVKTTDRFGKANNAYVFDGSTNYMSVPNSASLNPSTAITLMAIVKINGFYAGNCVSNQILGKGYNDFIDGLYALRFGSVGGCGHPVDASKELFGGEYGNYTDARASAGDVDYIQTNKWYEVVYTYESGVSKIYVNGVLKNTATSTPIFTANTKELFIGKHGDPQYPYWFTGTIDEIRIYNKALCAGAVTQLNGLSN